MAFFRFPAPGGAPGTVLEDEDWVVLWKPAGMHTSPVLRPGAAGDEGTLLSWAVERYPEIGRVPGRGRGEGGLLHRLDRETSGLVLFARNEVAFRALAAAAADGRFRKDYVLRAVRSGEAVPGCRPGLVSPGGVEPREWFGTDDPGSPESRAAHRAFLVRSALEAGRPVPVESFFRAFGPGSARVACAAAGEDLGRKKSVWGRTLYRTSLLVASPGEEGWVEFRVCLSRGFRHQVRAHMAWTGFPLLGDSLYGSGEADRVFLHAFRIEFPHPRTGYAIVVEG